MRDYKIIALAVIEFIAGESDTEYFSYPGGPDNNYGTIYKFSHVVAGHCKNPHHQWMKELKCTYMELVKANILPPYRELR